MKLSLPLFFGFESIGVLFRDEKSQDGDELFTIAEVNEKQWGEEPGDEYQGTTIIKFPTSLGVTGNVYHSGEIYICNKAEKDSKFHSDIDNLGSTGDVYNFMIGPIYGHPTRKNV